MPCAVNICVKRQSALRMRLASHLVHGMPQCIRTLHFIGMGIFGRLKNGIARQPGVRIPQFLTKTFGLAQDLNEHKD